MTAPDYVAQAAELLTEHSPMTSVDALHNCACGWAPDDHWPTLAEFGAHLAEVLAAAGLIPTSTEWGVQGRKHVVVVRDLEHAKRFAPYAPEQPIYSRAVTDWKDASDD